MSKEKTAIIILNYNGLPYIIDCLKSLDRLQDYKTTRLQKLSMCGQARLQVILVDNNSSDNSISQITKKFPKVEIIKNKKNLGFAEGNNIGIKWALKKDFDYIMLLNPDIIAEKNFLNPLIQLIKLKKENGIVAPVLKEKRDGRIILSLGAKLNPVLGRTKHLDVNAGLLHSVEQEMVSGCAMMVKKEVFEKIGLFDKRFFLYFEDSDFCIRARRAGFKVYVEPKSAVLHKTSSSIGGQSLKKARYVLWSNLLFINKHIKPYFWPAAYCYLIILGLKMALSVFWNKKSSAENIVPGIHNKFSVSQHLSRYYFAKKFVEKSDLVLDAACGSGYGTKILAQKTKKVFGIDKSKKILLLARLRYALKNTVFKEMDCLSLAFKKNIFDKLVSMETIEHLADPDKFLKEVKRVLKPGGIFIVSTPNRETASSDFSVPDNLWHFKEYNRSEFKNLLSSYFKKVEIYSQIMESRAKLFKKENEKVQKARCNFAKKDRLDLRKIFPQPLKEFLWHWYAKLMLLKSAGKITYKDFPIIKKTDKKAMMLVAVCR